MRFVVAFLFAVPLTAQEPAPTPFQERKARVLLREQLSCLGCHELDGDGGRSAPSLSTVGQRRTAAYIRAMIADPQQVVPGAAMPKTEMPASTRDVVVRFLARNAKAGIPPAAIAVPRTPQPEPRTLYLTWCASCHGERGDGSGPNARYLPTRPATHSSADAMGSRSDDALFDAIAGGGAIMGRSARMPAFGATLTSSEIRALVGYIRALCNCVGPVWSRDGTGR